MTPDFSPNQTEAAAEDAEVEAEASSTSTTETPALEITTQAGTTVSEAVVTTPSPQAQNLTLLDLTWYTEPTINILQNGTETAFTVAGPDVSFSKSYLVKFCVTYNKRFYNVQKCSIMY